MQNAIEQAILTTGREHFLEKTNLIHKLANRHLKETGIYMAVELAYYDYIKDLKNDDVPHIQAIIIFLEGMKLNLIDAIIKASKQVENER